MSNVFCTLRKRTAVWTILDVPLCEAHKEKVIENWGVDRFPIERLEADDVLFQVRGRHKAGPQLAGLVRKKLQNP